MLGQVEGGGVHRQQAQAERFHGLKILKQDVAKAGQILGPLIAALVQRVGRLAGPAPGRDLAADKKRLANIRLAVRLVLAVLGLLKARRHIADAFGVDLDGQLAVERQGVKARVLGEHAVNQLLGHAVVLDEKEADVFERPADFPAQAGQGAGLASQKRPQVQDRNDIVIAQRLGFFEDERAVTAHGFSLRLTFPHTIARRPTLRQAPGSPEPFPY